MLSTGYPSTGKPATEYIYDYDPWTGRSHPGKLVMQKDETGTQHFDYGNMGEVTGTIRTFALPLEIAQPMAFETHFEYDSWGRTQSITYPDGEIVHYGYDFGGMLKSVAGEKNGENYAYVNDVFYNKFGQKTTLEYGNGVQEKFHYDNLNQRLAEHITRINSYEYLTSYTYDILRNIAELSSNVNSLGEIIQTFDYDPANKLVYAKEHNQGCYENTITYNSSGRIKDYILTGYDPFLGIARDNTQSYTYPQTGCFPIESLDGQGTNTLDWDIRSSLRRKASSNKARYYLFDNEDHLKVFSNNAETFSYYSYDAGGERTAKLNYSTVDIRNNAGQSTRYLELEKATLYPNGYMAVNQNGDYTKHYYMDNQRICSKIGSGNNSLASPYFKVWNDHLDGIYLEEKSSYQKEYAAQQLKESILNDEKEVSASEQNLNCYNTCWQGKAVYSHDPNAYESLQFFYHSDHLGSTSMVTDYQSNVSQSIIYAPFGEVVSEYVRNHWNDYTTDYLFNAKELDEESGMYYYSARYYESPMFISRDPLHEKRPWESPYSYCGNNPLNRVDPTGMIWDDPEQASALKSSISDKITLLDKKLKEHRKVLKETSDIDVFNELTDKISGFQDRVSNMSQSLADIDRLGADQDNIYVLNGSGGNVTKISDNKVSINGFTEGLQIHEITHVRQSLDAGGLDFVGGKLQYASFSDFGVANEVEAYQKQFSFNGFFPFNSSINSVKQINAAVVGEMKVGGTGAFMYPEIRSYVKRKGLGL